MDGKSIAATAIRHTHPPFVATGLVTATGNAKFRYA
jgi:hypothetical protein